ncbi:MAG: response regulator [Actinomycetota bacterium]
MMEPLRVLLVEDSEDDALLLLRELRQGGYEPRSERVETASAMQAALDQQKWDIIIADYTLPRFSGLAALNLLKENEIDLPFLIVSGTVNEEMAVAVMKAGAHDYLMKGNLARLLPTVERELREARIRQSQKQAQEQLREQAALLDVTQDAIFVQDLADCIHYWNKSAERLYGYSAQEAQGQKVTSLVFTTTSLEYLEAKQHTIEKGLWQGELKQLTKHQKAITVESRWKLLLAPQGQPKSILVVNTDITEKKLLEAQFFRAQRLESIGTIAGGIAHDLNNVLAPILMSVELLKMKLPDDSSQKLLETLTVSAKRGGEIVKQVLTFAKGVEGSRGDLQLRHLVREILQIAKETFPKSIEITANAPRDLWTICGDATQLQQVLLNLCVNARDAMPQGGTLTLKAENIILAQNCDRLHCAARPGAYILLTVSDTGIGISPEIIDQIFEPFFTTKPEGRGTGLGLSTVLGIVKSHQGFINVETQPGEGTCFKIYLPAKTASSLESTKPEKEVLPSGGGELILIVDDEASIRDIAKQILKAYGYQVLTAEDGTEALALYVQYQEDIKAVIVDLKMPIMDGPITIRALRKINPQLKIMLSSGSLASIQMSEENSLGIQAVLQKPYTAPILLKTLYRVLSSPTCN